jgi:hypothetical protein
MLSEDMVRSIETGRRRDIEAALRRRRLLGAPVRTTRVARLVRALTGAAVAAAGGNR